MKAHSDRVYKSTQKGEHACGICCSITPLIVKAGENDLFKTEQFNMLINKAIFPLGAQQSH